VDIPTELAAIEQEGPPLALLSATSYEESDSDEDEEKEMES
jgi:hypothetical protein